MNPSKQLVICGKSDLYCTLFLQSTEGAAKLNSVGPFCPNFSWVEVDFKMNNQCSTNIHSQTGTVT